MPEGKVQIGVGVLVMNPRNQVLLGKRKSKLGASTFSLPGGHLEFGETPEECARRELKEETDLDGSDFAVVSLSNDIAYEKHYVTVGVVVRKFAGEVRVMEADKFESWDWYSWDDLPAPLFVPSAKFMDNFTHDIFYK